MQFLASFELVAAAAGECVFSGPIETIQVRADADAGTISFNDAITFDRSLYDAITSRARWTGSVVEFDGDTIVVGRLGDVSFDENLPGAGSNTGEQATMRLSPVGDRWAIPSLDFVPPDPSTCPVSNPISARRSPRMIGNKPTTFSLLLGASPKNMKTRRMFQGQSLQKSNRGNVAITGEVTSVDDSALYVNKPLCYQLMPFSGLRRDEVIRQVAELVGLDPVTQVICPIGKVVKKPILLTNASLLTFVNDFVAPENWYASFDEFGRLYVRPIERKDAPALPDWELDAALGDFDYDSLEEVPPSSPATKIIVQASIPVAGTGPGGSSLTLTTRTIEEESELYAPRCVKVRPSGLASFLYGDGSYRTIAEEEIMLVGRQISDVTTVNGQETARTVQVFGFHNPAAFNPNYNTLPKGTSFDGAYGDHTFHRDEAESLMLVNESTFGTLRDIYGTILGTLEIEKTWDAPNRAVNYVLFDGHSRTYMKNNAGLVPPAYVYSSGTAGATRILPAAVYGVVKKVEKTYQYAADGTLSGIEEILTGWMSPTSRCDLIQVTSDDGDETIVPDDPPGDGPPGPPPSPPPDDPPAPDDGPPPSWYPNIIGPIAQDGGRFTFTVSLVGGNLNPGATTCAPYARIISGAGSPPVHGEGAGGPIGALVGCTLFPGVEEQGNISVTFGGSRPGGGGAYTIYVGFRIPSGSGANHLSSNNIIFDPWQSVPPGGNI